MATLRSMWYPKHGTTHEEVEEDLGDLDDEQGESSMDPLDENSDED